MKAKKAHLEATIRREQRIIQLYVQEGKTKVKLVVLWLVLCFSVDWSDSCVESPPSEAEYWGRNDWCGEPRRSHLPYFTGSAATAPAGPPPLCRTSRGALRSSRCRERRGSPETLLFSWGAPVGPSPRRSRNRWRRCSRGRCSLPTPRGTTPTRENRWSEPPLVYSTWLYSPLDPRRFAAAHLKDSFGSGRFLTWRQRSSLRTRMRKTRTRTLRICIAPLGLPWRTWAYRVVPQRRSCRRSRPLGSPPAAALAPSPPASCSRSWPSTTPSPKTPWLLGCPQPSCTPALWRSRTWWRRRTPRPTRTAPRCTLPAR